MRCQVGFTLIELMVVVAIIGVLAAIAVPAYSAYVTRAQVVEGITLADELKPAIRDYYKERGAFPADNADAAVPAADKLLGNYVQQMAIEKGAIHIKFGHYAHALLQDKILSLRPISVIDSPLSPISWACGNREPPPGMEAAGENHTDIDPKLLPGACRG